MTNFVHKKVKFQDNVYWLHTSSMGCLNLSPLNHYSENGDLLADNLDDSFGIILDGCIYRYGQKIGLIEDLEELK